MQYKYSYPIVFIDFKGLLKRPKEQKADTDGITIIGQQR